MTAYAIRSFISNIKKVRANPVTLNIHPTLLIERSFLKAVNTKSKGDGKLQSLIIGKATV